ncbi:hypothetical protein FCN77_04850 [Arthrobacter sp. 24S4-2]|uniref:DUF6318 family protein n=1 Tax=Arthrobacter sp. 24S4-2 TaxID=2575374 RepID=UPI0010C7E15E|nr:DUF6318 family protein [Arthrobacter sp. 24S4-2]QCO97174.1 hypothetical protein FCN77_04850 [Arthrobacter sp. 24S4-2]
MTSSTWHSARLRYSTAALLTASVLVLTACNEGNNPPGSDPTSASASASTSASVTPSPTPTPSAAYKPADAKGKAQNVPVPVLPEAAKAETKEGAMAFAGYWFNLLSYGYETGDLAPLNGVTSSSCGPCDKAKQVIHAWHSEGRWLVGGKVAAVATSTTFNKSADATYQVAVQARQTSLTYMRQDGSVARSDPQPDDTGNLLFVAYENGTWRLSDIGKIVG